MIHFANCLKNYNLRIVKNVFRFKNEKNNRVKYVIQSKYENINAHSPDRTYCEYSEIKEIIDGDIIISDCIKRRILYELEETREQEMIYRKLKEDGQFFRYFMSFFEKLHKRLKSKVNYDFKNNKIPNDKIEFINNIKVVLDEMIKHEVEYRSQNN